MIKTYDIEAKERPKWYQLRWKLSNFFVWIAKILYPENPEVKAFLVKRLTDFMIYGECIERIDPSKVYENSTP